MDQFNISKIYTIFTQWVSESYSVVSDYLQPYGLYSPWNSPGQNIGMCSLSLLQGVFPTQGSNPGLSHIRRILYQLGYKRSPAAKSLQSCLTLCYPIDGSPPGSTIPGILQARILERIAMPSSRGSFQPRDQSQASHIIGRLFIWVSQKLWFFSSHVWL